MANPQPASNRVPRNKRNASDTSSHEAALDVNYRQPQDDDPSSYHNVDTGEDSTTTNSSGLQTLRNASIRTESTKRIKWSREMNINVIRIYLRINECRDDPLPGWRQKLHKEFIKTFPEYTVTEQNLADRKNVIIKKKYLTQVDIDKIRREVGNEFHNNDVAQPFDSESINQDEASMADINATNERSEEISGKLTEYFSLFRDSDPFKRPKIPKLIFHRSTIYIIKQVNDALPAVAEMCNHLTDIHTALYAAAVCAIDLNGQHTSPKAQCRTVRTDRKPAWQFRLEKKIKLLRTEINTIHEYLANNKSRKVKFKINNIFKKANISPQDPEKQQRIIDLLDTTRQKLKATGARLRRYNETSKRKQQNKIFQTNQKAFYRSLECDKLDTISSVPLDQTKCKSYWEDIWCRPSNYNTHATWLPEIEEKITVSSEMSNVSFSDEDIRVCTRKTLNWKAPGPDNIQNFWLKRFNSLYPYLSKYFNEILQHPDLFPVFLAEGITYLIQKTEDGTDPKNFRPITCLSVVYKLLTSLIHEKVYEHCHQNSIISFEQKGCMRDTYGCKEQLTIDSIIIKQAEVMCRNISMCYIDYRKAFDLVPHDWLLKVLKLYKISTSIINLLAQMMKHWRTQIQLQERTAFSICISRGIFQGDTLSPLWFCLALNPLSELMKLQSIGYRLNLRDCDSRINHLLFMDDIKLYAENDNSLHSLCNVVREFSDDIQMSFGLDKCSEIHLKKGKPVTLPQEDCTFQQISSDATYKYLGIQQNNRINHTQLKAEFKSRYRIRLFKLLNTKLNSKNLFTAINTYAVSTLIYSFGILKYSDTDLRELDTMTRTALTKFRFHHPNSAVERLYLPRYQAGRGLVNIFNLCKSQENKMRTYFINSTCPLLKKIVLSDANYSALNLRIRESFTPLVDDETMCITWQNKTLHGKYPHLLKDTLVDKNVSVQWLKRGYLFPETEGFIIAIQDGVMRTRNYEKYILKRSEVADICRLCSSRCETIEHIIAGCPTLSNSAYLGRHNEVAKIIHRQLAIKHGLIENPPPFYKYAPSAILESGRIVLYWDRPIITDRAVDYNRPDIVIIDKQNKTAQLIDVSCPLTNNLQKTEFEKISKYQNLSVEIQHIWQLSKVETIPLVISATGVTTKKFSVNLKQLEIPNGLINTIQKAVILQTCHIVRKFLN